MLAMGYVSKLAPRVIGYNMFRYFKQPIMHPFNLTISVTGRCNSRCKTCNVWKHKPKRELSTDEWSAVLESVGRSPVWISVSGGEPFLREDLADIIKLVSVHNRPDIITIATNGILTKKIIEDAKKILSFYRGELIINISIDAVGARHDEIRGVKCYEQVIKTFMELREFDRLNLGIHTVISKYNIDDIKELSRMVEKLSPDSFICQIAENRKELRNMDMDIIPEHEEYVKTLELLQKRSWEASGVSRITKRLRSRYYELTKNNRALPCFAGLASAHINYDGSLWACCVKCKSMGNLPDSSFEKLWKGKKAGEIRARIKKERCSCNMANAYYSNMICDPLCVFL